MVTFFMRAAWAAAPLPPELGGLGLAGPGEALSLLLREESNCPEVSDLISWEKTMESYTDKAMVGTITLAYFGTWHTWSALALNRRSWIGKQAVDVSQVSFHCESKCCATKAQNP